MPWPTRLLLIHVLAPSHGNTVARIAGNESNELGEDDGDHTRLVDLQRDVGALTAVHAAARHPFRELHRYPSLARLDRDDREDHGRAIDDDHHELQTAGFGPEPAPPWNGSRETTDAKISIDIPLPIPRWVISSPSHITRRFRPST